MTTAADGWALDISEVRRRAHGGVSTARGDLHWLAQAQYCQNHQETDPVGVVQGGVEAKQEFKLPDVEATGDGP